MLGFHVRVSYLQTVAVNFKQDKLNNWELEKTNANRNKVKQAQRPNYRLILEAKVRIKEIKRMETNWDDKERSQMYAWYESQRQRKKKTKPKLGELKDWKERNGKGRYVDYKNYIKKSGMSEWRKL